MHTITQPAAQRKIVNAQQLFITVALSLIRALTENQAVYWFSGSFLFLLSEAEGLDKQKDKKNSLQQIHQHATYHSTCSISFFPPKPKNELLCSHNITSSTNKKSILMSPFSIYHFHNNAIEQLQPYWTDAIIQSANPDMIFLLGASLHRRRSESIFQYTSPSSQHIGDFFFLVLIGELGNKTLNDWQDKIEANIRHMGAASVWVLSTNRFQEWLKQGHSFAVQVWQKAVRLHDKGIIPATAVAASTIDETEIEKSNAAGKNRATEFLAGAEQFVERKQFSMAAFMLHQCAEQTLITLVKTRTGYHANTHSIERLLRLAELVSYQIRDVLPRTTEKQKSIFGRLQKAYIDARYKTEYQATEEDIDYLLPKVKYLVELL